MRATTMVDRLITTAPDSGGGSYTGSASGSARAALDLAYSRIGTPYVWGGTGPVLSRGR
ncbi:cell wall-associated NlpC family hydrolase [Spinactinospora alkalitolerans]|uniref:Cell wall-associated NlpC family hydrolase n=1 Tax=Spinactinospora alkalitolerans TaxID=687207 RepID=A0A852TUU6_9ACTN|nr:cell wall-associated NlpC family hydrolase [Spinactinospora alkalitolerans]